MEMWKEKQEEEDKRNAVGNDVARGLHNISDVMLIRCLPTEIPFHDALMEELLKIHPCAPTLAYGPSSHEIKHERRHSTAKYCRCQRVGTEFKTCGRVRRFTFP